MITCTTSKQTRFNAPTLWLLHELEVPFEVVDTRVEVLA